MSYIKLEDTILTDTVIMAAGPEGFTLWVKGLSYSGLHMLDGFVPEEALLLISIGIKSVKKTVQALLDLGLWIKVDGGYALGRDSAGLDKWSKHQTPKEFIEASRAAERARKADYRARQAGHQKDENLFSPNGTTHGTGRGTNGHVPPGQPVGQRGGVPPGPFNENENEKNTSNSCSVPNVPALRLEHGGKPPDSAFPVEKIIIDEEDRQAWVSKGQRWQRACGVVDRVPDHVADGDL